MNRFKLALAMFAVLTVSACANGGSWTPMSEGRTAGKGTVENSAVDHKADSTFSKSLRK
jgi:hypothetical protein